jgi:hypothetical protein
VTFGQSGVSSLPCQPSTIALPGLTDMRPYVAADARIQVLVVFWCWASCSIPYSRYRSFKCNVAF